MLLGAVVSSPCWSLCLNIVTPAGRMARTWIAQCMHPWNILCSEDYQHTTYMQRVQLHAALHSCPVTYIPISFTFCSVYAGVSWGFGEDAMVDEEGEEGDAGIDWRIYMQACTYFLLNFLLCALLVQTGTIYTFHVAVGVSYTSLLLGQTASLCIYFSVDCTLDRLSILPTDVQTTTSL